MTALAIFVGGVPRRFGGIAVPDGGGRTIGHLIHGRIERGRVVGEVSGVRSDVSVVASGPVMKSRRPSRRFRTSSST